MKKIALFSLLATLAFGMANAQNDEKKDVPANGAKIRFVENIHNYGNIAKGSDGKCTFTFFNDGNEPLILQNVKASCGCTTPSYTQKPVMPGQSGTIDVKYNTNNVGSFSKTIRVTSNAVDNPNVTLTIRGNVQQAAASEPAKVEPKPAPQQQLQKPAEQAPVMKPAPRLKN